MWRVQPRDLWRLFRSRSQLFSSRLLSVSLLSLPHYWAWGSFILLGLRAIWYHLYIYYSTYLQYFLTINSFCLLFTIYANESIIFNSSLLFVSYFFFFFCWSKFSLSGKHPYHKSCFKELTHPRCEVCYQFVRLACHCLCLFLFFCFFYS